MRTLHAIKVKGFKSIANAEHYTWGEGCDGSPLALTPSVVAIAASPGSMASLTVMEARCTVGGFVVSTRALT